MQQISPWRMQRLPNTVDAEVVSQSESEEFHLRDYLKMVLKRRRVVVLVFLAVLGLGGYLTFSQTPFYTASATLKIDPQDPGVIQLHELLAGQGGGGAAFDYYETQFALLKSRPLAARVIAELDLASDRAFTQRIPPNLLEWLQSWAFGLLHTTFATITDLIQSLSSEQEEPVPDEGSPQAGEATGFQYSVDPGLISRYLRFLEVNPVKNTRLVKIVFTTPSPRLSQQLANTHAETFIRTTLETRFELTKEAREFLEKKLAELEVKVRRAEEALQRFRQTHGVVSLEGNENLVVERMVDLNKRLTEARTRRIELESLYKTVENRDARYLSEIIDNSVIQQLRTSILNLEAERARLSTTFMPSHPRLVELDEQLREARRRVEREIGNVVRKIESDYGAARAREAALEAEATRQQQAALGLKELGVQYSVLQAEAESNRTLHGSVLKRLHETTMSNDAPISNIQVVEYAENPQFPSSPQTQRNLLLAMACGLFLGVGLALFLEYMDASVSTPQDVWQAAALPTLGVVPHLKSLRSRGLGYGYLPVPSPSRWLARRASTTDQSFAQELIVSHHPFSIVSESYHTLCTTLLFSQPENPPRVILFTSAQPGDGKTVTTINMAIALAQAGNTVVVVDADLRKGKCHTLLGLENHHGLSNVLSGKLPVEEGVQKVVVPGLSLLTRGILYPNPTALLAVSRMKEVIASLRQRFDFVLIDSPPAIAISDAAILSQLCDGVSLVLRAHTTSIETLQRLVERLEAVRAPILGVILNGIDLRTPDYVDYQHYYSSYYDSMRNGAGG
ncbi:MAG: polysaccharide biosynthesis tyrosine autokinase [Thermodesulfobacteriota bacterium]